jgi:hypothetical protein
MAYREESVDLERLFGAVLRTLRQNRRALNNADEANHDHGDNMVDTFASITQAMRDTSGQAPSRQLAYAAALVRSRKSGSAQMYADGLAQAATEFEGTQVTRTKGLALVQTLLGGGHAAHVREQQQEGRGLGDLLGSMLGGQQQQQPQQSSGGLGGLLGSMLGGQQQQQPQQSSGGLGDLFGSMLGGQQQQQQPQQSDGLDTGDLLKAGLAYMSAKAQGASNLQAIVSAVVAASAMGSGYREQSSSLVASTLLNVIQSMAAGS